MKDSKNCTIPNSTVGKKITSRSPYPTSLKSHSTGSTVPLHRASDGNFGTRNPDKSAANNKMTNYNKMANAGNFTKAPVEPRIRETAKSPRISNSGSTKKMPNV
jgi:hypothetical protein